MKVGDLVIPRDKGWKKYTESRGIIIGLRLWGHRPETETAIVHWFSGGRNEWALNQLEVLSGKQD